MVLNIDAASIVARPGVDAQQRTPSAKRVRVRAAGQTPRRWPDEVHDTELRVWRASDTHLDLDRAPYGLYGVEYIDLVSLRQDGGPVTHTLT